MFLGSTGFFYVGSKPTISRPGSELFWPDLNLVYTFQASVPLTAGSLLLCSSSARLRSSFSDSILWMVTWYSDSVRSTESRMSPTVALKISLREDSRKLFRSLHGAMLDQAPAAVVHSEPQRSAGGAWNIKTHTFTPTHTHTHTHRWLCCVSVPLLPCTELTKQEHRRLTEAVLVLTSLDPIATSGALEENFTTKTFSRTVSAGTDQGFPV